MTLWLHKYFFIFRKYVLFMSSYCWMVFYYLVYMKMNIFFKIMNDNKILVFYTTHIGNFILVHSAFLILQSCRYVQVLFFQNTLNVIKYLTVLLNTWVFLYIDKEFDFNPPHCSTPNWLGCICQRKSSDIYRSFRWI